MTTKLPLSHRRPATCFDRFWYGACYYPEQWDAATRSQDAARMAAAGINIVRMAEFAWDLLEPVENLFDFALFDEVIDTLGQHGISTLLCTPTAAPPRWLTEKHPEILRVDDSGLPLSHGSRQHACTTNPVFRDYSRRITQAMARHFHGNPHVVGWQTDNEFHCHFSECHCPACQTGFRDFLRHKYRDVGELNQAWGNAFWSQTVAGFEAVVTPRAGQPTYPNPAARLDYARFLSAATSRFQHEQVQILRKANAAWWITHNGLFGNLDYRGTFGQDLDVLGYDLCETCV